MLHYQTVDELLMQVLDTVMSSEVFAGFRLVGGTSLSLQLGHRISIDIDLFSDELYGNIDFVAIEQFITQTFQYYDFPDTPPALGKSYFVGPDKEKSIKLDIFYTDPFIQPAYVIDNIRLATIEEVIAMKIDIIQRGGRKKDFWDLHAVLKNYSIEDMLTLHKKRYEYSHDERSIIRNFTDFGFADEDFDPVCLHGKYWEFIKEDITDAVNLYIQSSFDKHS